MFKDLDVIAKPGSKLHPRPHLLGFSETRNKAAAFRKGSNYMQGDIIYQMVSLKGSRILI